MADSHMMVATIQNTFVLLTLRREFIRDEWKFNLTNLKLYKTLNWIQRILIC